MKKTSFLLMLFMAFVMMAVAPQSAWAISGSGTSSSPYLIGSASDWDDFRTKVNSRSNASTQVYAKLTSNISISSGEYTPVGTSSKPFCGEFDGNGKSINLANVSTKSDNFGLFGYVKDATIKNLKVTGSINVSGAQSHIGGIVGNLAGSSTIKGCTFNGTLDAGSSSDCIGGIVGYAQNTFSGSITNCFCRATLITTTSSVPYIGGILGYFNDENNKKPTIQYNFSDTKFLKTSVTNISSGTYTNGIIGRIRAHADNVKYNTFIKNGNITNAINTDSNAAIDGSNKSISINVSSSNTNHGSIRHSYVEPSTSSATQLEVTASPTEHYHFSSWSDNGKQSHTVGLTSDVTLTATFAIDRHTITLNKNYDYRCKVYINGVESTGGTYDYGTKLTLKAIPDTYCYFGSWTNENSNKVSSAAEFSYTLTGNTTLTANCFKSEYTLTLQSNNNVWGTVYGGGKCDAYTDVSIKATPTDHYHFVNWTKDGEQVSTSAETQYRVHSNETLVANFAINSYAITVSSADEEMGTVTGSDSYVYGTEHTITATPKEGYHFVSWHDGNTEASRQITVTGTATYIATFEAHKFTSQITTEAYKKSDATCTQAAAYYYKCCHCEAKGTNYYFSTEEKDKAFHSYSDSTNTLCTVCNHSWIYYTATERITPKTGTLSGYSNNNHSFNSETLEGVIEFPSALTSIGADAFYNRNTLQSISLPDGLTSIGKNAFMRCEKLQSIDIPSSVTSIGESAFQNCYGLKSISIPEGVTVISIYMFADCSSLKSVIIPSSVSKINYQAFYRCSSLESIIIPKGIKTLGRGIFFGCSKLANVAFNSIPNYPLEDTFYKVPDSCTYTLTLTDGSYVADEKGYSPTLTEKPTFSRTLTTTWETLVVPFDITIDDENDDYEFYTIKGVNASELFTDKATGTLAAGTPVLIRKKCNGDYNLTLTANSTDISTTINNPAEVSGLTFKGTFSNTTVGEGEGYVFVGNKFVKTTAATNVAPFHAYLAGAIEDISALDISTLHVWSDNSHTYCTECEHSWIYYTATDNIEGIRPNNDARDYESDFYGNSLDGYIEFSFPLTSIDVRAFENNSRIRSIILPSTVTSIGYRAFSECSNLQSINIPEGVTFIGADAFWKCSSLQSIDIPEGVTQINSLTFKGCTSLESVTLPSSLESLGMTAFAYCTSLKTVAFNSIPEVNIACFSNASDSCTYSLKLSDGSHVKKGHVPTLTEAPTYTRTGIKNQWGTLVVPFAVGYDNSKPYDLYTLSSVEEGVISLTKVTSTLPAGTPVLIRMSEAARNAETGKYDLTLTAAENSVSTTLNNASSVNDLTLTGAYSVTDITDKNGYIIANNMFWSIQDVKGENNVYCAPFRAYLEAYGNDLAPQLRIGSTEEDNETFILEVLNDINSDETELFDMNGRHIDDLQSGTNIVKRGNRTFKVIIK